MSPSRQSRIILASTSPARRQLIQTLGLPFEVEAPGVDEEVPHGTSVSEAVALLAERKARAIHLRHPDALVVGSDQLAAVDGVALGKPSSREQARDQLVRISGRSHEIVTGLCVLGPGFRFVEVDTAELTVYPLADDELERYLDLDEWKGCAGGYRVEGAGQALFRDLRGDRSAVMGLPMLRLVRALRRAGVRFFD